MRRLAFSLVIALAVGVLVSVPPLGARSGETQTFEVRSDGFVPPLAPLQQIWRARLPEYGVTARDGALGVVVVEVSGAPVAEADTIVRALTEPGHLAFVEVLNDTDASKAMLQAVRAGGGEVLADVDVWTHDDTGQQFDDYYVYGPSIEAIAARLDAVWADDEATRLEDGQAIVYEHVVPYASDEADGVAEPFFRTYIVDAEPWLTGEHVADASTIWDPQTNRPEVLLELTADGARRFGEMTQELVGRKLAMVIDDRVVMAPVIQGAITGGRTNISMGGGTAADQQREADALVRTLRSRSTLPDGLTASLVGTATTSAAAIWAKRVGVGLGAGVLAWLLAWFAARSGVERARRGRRGRLALSRPLAIRIAVTIAAPALLVLARWVPLPRLGLDASSVFAATPESISIVGLGVTPVLLAYVLVELVAHAIPSLRARRHGGPAQRAPLERATLRLAVVIALAQGWFFATFLQTANGAWVQIVAPGLEARAQVALALAAGAMLPALAAAVITRWGVCNGWHAVIATAAALVLYDRITTAPAGGTDDVRLGALAAAALVAAVVIAVVSVRHRGTRLPPGGALPLLAVPFVITLALIPLLIDPGLVAKGLRVVVDHTRWISLAAIAATVAITAAWRQPWRIAAVVGLCGVLLALTELMPARTVDVVLASALFAVMALGVLAGARAHATITDPVVLAEIHHAERADGVADALAEAGVAHELVGIHAQALLPGLAPFAPTTIIVPRARLDDATRLADRVLRPADITPDEAAAPFA